METHQPDPTSRAEADPWEEVHERMSELGNRLQETYRKVAAEHGPTEEEIREAIGTLAGVWGQVSSSVGAVLHDPELRLRLKSTAAALAEALGDTVSGVAKDLRDAEEE